MALTAEQAWVLNKALEGHNLTLTGQAGTGKSFLMRKLYEALRKAGTVCQILCTTGMACMQYNSYDLGAKTVHSWAGMMDGRYDNLTLGHLLNCDDKFQHVFKNVQSCQAILIDEVSMLSKKDFDQLEFVCRAAGKSPASYFGGLQVICCGDFYQLPPVGNALNCDSGQYCFESEVYQRVFKHRLNLETVLRQSEQTLIQAVSQTAKGCVSTEIDTYLQTLKRPLLENDQNAAVHLFARNIDSDVYNQKQLEKLEGELKVHTATTNKGSANHLRRILAPQHLNLKTGCPVMLLRNLSGKLVNGLCGTVVDMTTDTVTVAFDTIKEVHAICKYLFTVYDTRSNSNVAERLQFPLRLAYSMTVHKAQGMTLDPVVVHCDGFFQQGQLSVAIGRATHSDGLQLIGYRKGLCFQPRKVVKDFYSIASTDFRADLACCWSKASEPVVGLDFESTTIVDSKSNSTIDSDDSLSDFDEREIQAVDEMLVDESDSSLIELPEHVDVDKILQAVMPTKTVTEKQQKIQTIFDSLDKENLSKFIQQHFAKFQEIAHKVPKETSKDMMINYHNYITLPEFNATLATLYGQGQTSDEHVYIGTSLAYHLFQCLVHEAATSVSKNVPEVVSKPEKVSDAGKSKVRYVGGMCVAKARTHYTNIARSNIGNPQKLAKNAYQSAEKILELIHLLEASKDNIDYNDPTLEEIERKQNITKGLTYINQPCFDLFLEIDLKVRELLTLETFKTTKEDIFQVCKNSILTDEGVLLLWDDCLDLDCDRAASGELFENLVTRYLMVSHKQFLIDTKDKMKFQKKKAHRKELISKEKKTPEVKITIDNIRADESLNRENSHLKLKLNCLNQPDFFNRKDFKKDDILCLCKVYGLHVSKSSKKGELSKILQDKIVSSAAFENLSALDDAPSCSKVGSKRSASRKAVPNKKWKGKGKGKKKYHCDVCEGEYVEGDDWIQCGGCNCWFDRICAKLDSESDWLQYTENDDQQWVCEPCMSMLM